MKECYDVIGVGIAAVDDLLYAAEYPPIDCKVPVIGTTRHGGGPACTAIAAAGVLGARAAYVARFGDDELSNFIRTALANRGVDTTHIVHDPRGGPYHSVIVVDAAAHRNVFYDPTLYRIAGPDDLPVSLVQSAKIVLIDHITEPSLLPVAEKVRRLGVPILSDIEGHTESALPLAGLTDYLVVPRAFACSVSGETNPRDACALLARTARTATVVTDGAQGCYVSTAADPQVRYFAAFQIDAFDTTGCGDTFHGSFAFAVARGVAVEDAILVASAAAALKAHAARGERCGWDALPTLEEVIKFLQARLDQRKRPSLLDALSSTLFAQRI